MADQSTYHLGGFKALISIKPSVVAAEILIYMNRLLLGSALSQFFYNGKIFSAHMSDKCTSSYRHM